MCDAIDGQGGVRCIVTVLDRYLEAMSKQKAEAVSFVPNGIVQLHIHGVARAVSARPASEEHIAYMLGEVLESDFASRLENGMGVFPYDGPWGSVYVTVAPDASGFSARVQPAPSLPGPSPRAGARPDPTSTRTAPGAPATADRPLAVLPANRPAAPVTGPKPSPLPPARGAAFNPDAPPSSARRPLLASRYPAHNRRTSTTCRGNGQGEGVRPAPQVRQGAHGPGRRRRAIPLGNRPPLPLNLLHAAPPRHHARAQLPRSSRKPTTRTSLTRCPAPGCAATCSATSPASERSSVPSGESG